MDANVSWGRLDAALRERGLSGLVQYAEPTDVDEYRQVDDARCPSEDAVRALLPESYRRFVAAYRCPAVEPSGLADEADQIDAADGCGWAFWPSADEPDGTGEPQVWYVEDSLPEEQVGTFAEWLDGMVAETLRGLASLGLVDASAHG